MLIQISTPRPLFDHSRHPEYVHIHTIAKTGVSEGQVLFTGPTDPEHGTVGTRNLEPYMRVPIDGEEGFEALIYVLPFWELFKEGKNRSMHDGEIVRSAPIALVRYCTAGFKVTAHSAFRTGPQEYQGRAVGFTIMTAATGGGVLRLADWPVDVANPTFDPWALHPAALTTGQQQDLSVVYNRTHRLSRGGAADLRAQRIASVEASMAKEGRALPSNRALPEKT